VEFPLVVGEVKSGVKPASSAAVVSKSRKPILLYEYKPAIDTRMDFVESHHIMEVLIKAYYCLYQHKVPTFIHCLTDLHDWYYLKVEKVNHSKLKIVWYKSIEEKVLSLDTHINFFTSCSFANARYRK
jgi:hypothetical protein